MRATHREAENRYESFRKLSRDKILESLPYADKRLIKLEGITPTSISAAKTWNSYHSRAVDWDWGFGYESYSRRYPKRFELATWYGNTLASLALGRPSYMGSHLRLDFIEALSENNPLKGRVVPIAISVAELYGTIIGASQLRIIDPIHKNLIDYYTSFGYTYFKQGTKKHYLVKDLS